MDHRNWMGALAEMKVAAALTEHHYWVFQKMCGACPFDLIAVKDEKLSRISVKGTGSKPLKYGGYYVCLKRRQSNTKRVKTVPFDKTQADVLAVYIHDIQQVCFIPVSKLNGLTRITIRPYGCRCSRYKQFVATDFLVPNF